MKKIFTIIATLLLCVNLIGCTDSTTKTQTSISTNTYYRDNIEDSESCQWYDNIKSNLGKEQINIMTFNGSVGFDMHNSEKIRDVMLSIEMDNPELKLLTEQYQIDFVTMNDDFTSIDLVLKLQIEDLTPVNNEITDIEKKVDNFISTLSNEMSDYEKVVAIHDWICTGKTYDYTMADKSHNLGATILGTSAVCDSFSGAFKYVCDKVGVTCLEVRGKSYSPYTNDFTEYHAWNIVCIDGNWKAVDCTYAIQMQEVENKILHDYCCIDIEESMKSFRPTSLVVGYTEEQVIGEG